MSLPTKALSCKVLFIYSTIDIYKSSRVMAWRDIYSVITKDPNRQSSKETTNWKIKMQNIYINGILSILALGVCSRYYGCMLAFDLVNKLISSSNTNKPVNLLIRYFEISPCSIHDCVSENHELYTLNKTSWNHPYSAKLVHCPMTVALKE